MRRLGPGKWVTLEGDKAGTRVFPCSEALVRGGTSGRAIESVAAARPVIALNVGASLGAVLPPSQDGFEPGSDRREGVRGGRRARSGAFWKMSV